MVSSLPDFRKGSALWNLTAAFSVASMSGVSWPAGPRCTNQDTLRGRGLAAIPFLDQQKVTTFLDRLGSLDESARVASDLV